jgi:hypothetical protein
MGGQWYAMQGFDFARITYILLFYGLFKNRFSVSQTMWRWMKEKQLTDVEGSGSGLIFCIILAFDWRDWRKPRKCSDRTVLFRTEIWKQDIPNSKQDR